MNITRAMRAWMVREAMADRLSDVFERGTGKAIATKLAEAYGAAHEDANLDDETDPVWDAAIEAAEEIDSLTEQEDRPKRKLTRHERLQAAADRGFDTWDDYNGER